MRTGSQRGPQADGAPGGVAEAGVSFIVPVYNKRAYLPTVLEGLAGQHGDFPREFVFVDDGSTDGSGELIGRLTAGWPSVHILRQPNRGPSIATNRGLAAARHPLIKLVDADDVLLPGATAVLRQALLHDPGAALALGGAEAYDAPGDALARLRAARCGTPTGEAGAPANRTWNALPALLRRCSFAPSVCMLRAETARAVGGCDERVFTQDYSLFLRLAERGAFLCVADPIALCPTGADNRVNDGGPQVLHDLNLALAFFLAEHEIAAGMARQSARRGVRRAWRWARRRENARVLAWSSLLVARAYLPIPGSSLGSLRRSCAAFAASRGVRRLPSD